MSEHLFKKLSEIAPRQLAEIEEKMFLREQGEIKSKEFELAMNGNHGMLIKLGVERLGQSDKPNVKISINFIPYGQDDTEEACGQ